MILIGMTIGSAVGSYAPVLFGAGVFSVTSIIAGGIGGLLGIYAGYKISENY